MNNNNKGVSSDSATPADKIVTSFNGTALKCNKGSEKFKAGVILGSIQVLPRGEYPGSTS
jgi:allophanate hydrolase subunit 2